MPVLLFYIGKEEEEMEWMGKGRWEKSTISFGIKNASAVV
jgi:hypothetical protein